MKMKDEDEDDEDEDNGQCIQDRCPYYLLRPSVAPILAVTWYL
jgi:hypothetical protein